jgi:hypothetical protein
MYHPCFLEEQAILTPKEFEVAAVDMDGFLTLQLRKKLEGRCSPQGFVKEKQVIKTRSWETKKDDNDFLRKEHTAILNSENNLFVGITAYTGLYGLFLLNSYWFCVMCKILFKKILANYSKKPLEIVSEKILSYTYFVNIFIAGYIYSFSPKQSNIYDMVGITTLSIFSYKYHNEEYKLLINKNNELNPRSNSNKLDNPLDQ